MDALLRRPLFHLHHVHGEFPEEVWPARSSKGEPPLCCLARLVLLTHAAARSMRCTAWDTHFMNTSNAAYSQVSMLTEF